ncbi:MAG: dual specificity protein phosphatase family protein [Pirellulaceae bacterium]
MEKIISKQSRNRDWWYARSVLYPTLGWNALLGRTLRLRRWWDPIDEHVILGARPFRKDVAALAALGVGGVVNTCEEFCGPLDLYRQHGIEQFHMPTIDFTHPVLQDIDRALEFMDRIIASGHKVYVHCKAGRGRSATVVMAYLLTRKGMTAADAQSLLLSKRPHVNRHLTERPVIQEIVQRQNALVQNAGSLSPDSSTK